MNTNKSTNSNNKKNNKNRIILLLSLLCFVCGGAFHHLYLTSILLNKQQQQQGREKQQEDHVDESLWRKKLSIIFNKLKTRGDIPNLLNKLELFGEGVEVGVRRGEFSRYILKNSKLRKLHMVDPWSYQDPKVYNDISNQNQTKQERLYYDLKMFMENVYPRRHCIHRGYSVEVSTKFPDDYFDFVYLDARHDYLGMMEDLRAWYPKVREGGLFAGHDYVEDGVNQAGEFGVSA